MDTATLETSEARLEKLTWGIRQRVSREFVNDVDIKTVTDAIADTITLLARGFVWAESESAQRQVIEYPDGWVQAIKDRWLPVWLKKKYQPRFRRVVVDVKAIYPTFHRAMPNEACRLTIMTPRSSVRPDKEG